MNYKLHYNKLIERAKERKLDCYTESHHIIPRCMNGSDDKDNLVNLTAREHFVAHILLVKIYPEEKGLINAVDMMTKGQDKRKIHNRMYGWLKEKFSETQSKRQRGEKNSQYGSIWISNISEEKNIKIKKDEFSTWEQKGWLKGRSIWNKYKVCKVCKKNYIAIDRENTCSVECSKKLLKKKKNIVKNIWIYNILEKRSKKIKKEELPVYEKQGWLKGRKMKF